MRLARNVALAAALLVPAGAQAAAGQVLFALGRVEIQRDGQAVAAARGTPVEVGDVISTGPTGMAQLRMQDGALLSLRHGSTLKVEEYQAPAPTPAAAATPGVVPAAAPGGRSVLRLLRGAFRTVTGLIGRGGGDAYRVVTPVATIGIRGTDYSAAYCSGDCGSTPDGLYLGVSSGGIEVANGAGTLALGNDQYGYVRDEATPPGRVLAPPEVLDTPVPPGDEGEEQADEGDGLAPDGEFREPSDEWTAGARDRPEGDYELRPAAASRYAYGGGPFFGAGGGGVYTDERGALVGFDGALSASIGTASNFDTGGDAATGLHWGRWHGGIANATSPDGPTTVDLSTASLHWIYAPVPEGPVVALTGQRSYVLAGGTNPTDNNGNVGVLAGASLFADFNLTALTVDTTVSVTFGDPAAGGTTWDAAGRGSISSGLFQGSYATVLINGGQFTGSGSFAGFFTADGAGAGLTFELFDANFTTSVNGAAAFVESTQGVAGP